MVISCGGGITGEGFSVGFVIVFSLGLSLGLLLGLWVGISIRCVDLRALSASEESGLWDCEGFSQRAGARVQVPCAGA